MRRDTLPLLVMGEMGGRSVVDAETRLLRVALDALAGALPGGVLAVLYDCLDQIEHFCREVSSPRAPDLPPQGFAFPTHLPSSTTWLATAERREQLLDRLDRHLAAGVGRAPEVARWFRLGDAIGGWEGATTASAAEGPLGHVVRLAQEIAASGTPWLPSIQRLASLVAGEGTPAPLLVRLVGLLPGELCRANPSRLDDDPHFLPKVIAWVTAGIEEDLATLVQEDAAVGRPTPRWDGARLWYRGEVVRKVRVGKAENVVAVLTAFEEASWPDTIPYPGEGDYQELHYTVRSLNKHLKALRFHADGTGRGIGWKLA